MCPNFVGAKAYSTLGKGRLAGMPTLTAHRANSTSAGRGTVFLAGALLAIVPGLYLAYSWYVGALDALTVGKEGGVIELLHVALTALAAFLFYLSWRQGKGPVRVAGGALAMLAAAAFVREADLELLSKAVGWRWLVFLGENGIQEVVLIAMTLPIFIYLYRNRSQFLDLVRLGLRWQAWALYVSGILVLLCVYLDARVVRGPEMRFWEELIETYSYVFMVLAAWRHLQLVGDPVWDRDPTDSPAPPAGRLTS